LRSCWEEHYREDGSGERGQMLEPEEPGGWAGLLPVLTNLANFQPLWHPPLRAVVGSGWEWGGGMGSC
jgi:hypothetical protein